MLHTEPSDGSPPAASDVPTDERTSPADGSSQSNQHSETAQNRPRTNKQKATQAFIWLTVICIVFVCLAIARVELGWFDFLNGIVSPTNVERAKEIDALEMTTSLATKIADRANAALKDHTVEKWDRLLSTQNEIVPGAVHWEEIDASFTFRNYTELMSAYVFHVGQVVDSLHLSDDYRNRSPEEKREIANQITHARNRKGELLYTVLLSEASIEFEKLLNDTDSYTFVMSPAAMAHALEAERNLCSDWLRIAAYFKRNAESQITLVEEQVLQTRVSYIVILCVLVFLLLLSTFLFLLRQHDMKLDAMFTSPNDWWMVEVIRSPKRNRSNLASKDSMFADPQVNVTKILFDTRDRLIYEVFVTRMKSRMNLIIGLFFSVTGLILLFVAIIDLIDKFDLNGNLEPAKVWTLLGIRLTVILLVQILAYYFFSLHRHGLGEIKHYHNELTNVESRLCALMLTPLDSTVVLGELVRDFTHTERNFVLKKGESTTALETTRILVDEQRQFVRELVGSLRPTNTEG